MRGDAWDADGDEELERLLAAASRELREDDFTANVMKVVRRSVRRRRIRVWVIGAAFATGVLLALGPLREFAILMWSVLQAIPWDDAGFRSDRVVSASTYSMPVVAVLVCGLVWPAVARWVAR